MHTAKANSYKDLTLTSVRTAENKGQVVRFTGSTLAIEKLAEKLRQFDPPVRIELTGKSGFLGSYRNALLDVSLYAVERLMKKDAAFRAEFVEALKGRGVTIATEMKEENSPDEMLKSKQVGELEIKAGVYFNNNDGKADSIIIEGGAREIVGIQKTLNSYNCDYRGGNVKRNFGIPIGRAAIRIDTFGLIQVLAFDKNFKAKYGKAITAAINEYNAEHGLGEIKYAPIPSIPLKLASVTSRGVRAASRSIITGETTEFTYDETSMKTHERLAAFLNAFAPNEVSVFTQPSVPDGPRKIIAIQANSEQVKIALNSLLPEKFQQPKGYFEGDSLRMISEQLGKSEPFFITKFATEKGGLILKSTPNRS